jgi:transcription-repair coupling factor (superfamily II helicase)
LKETDFKELFADTKTDTLAPKFVKDCAIDTDTEMLIPDEYVNNINERLVLYRQLDEVHNEQELAAYELQLLDRFGPIPAPVFQLFEAIRLRWIATDLGFERVQIKDKVMRCFFIGEQQSRYYESEQFIKLMSFVNNQGQRCTLRQTEKNLMLLVKNIDSVERAKAFLSAII